MSSILHLSESEQRIRYEKIAKLKTVSDEVYKKRIPNEMTAEYLNKMCVTIFGVDMIEIYLQRNIFDAQAVIISDFAENGFFWAQIENEAVSDEYKKLYHLINEAGESNNLKLPKLDSKWCIGKYEGEWFRAYIDKVLDNQKIRVFFVDYGTFGNLDHKDTRELEDDDVWSIHPLALPCVFKDLRPSQLSAFKELQYQSFLVKQIKMIEKNCVFEVEMMFDAANTLLSKIQ